ncbi:MAG: hypothetical protein HZC04_00370 [Candidatus Lloydbacteria bacterium]|nr:hypothetical protein [Candidatus Lloydbacteria bacterium]
MYNRQNNTKYIFSSATPKRRAGFVLLYAVLVASIALSVGLSIYSIALKELRISSSSRDSQLAFYAADAGTECALYWDVQERAFSTSTQNAITCAGSSMTVGGGVISDFSLPALPNGACASVNVNKSSPVQTVVTSRGYNTCNLGDPRRVERALRVTY